MANTVIQLKNSGGSGNTPGTLQPGELAINYADGKLYYGNAVNTAILFDAITEPAGLNQEIQFNNSGAFGASANLKFDSSTKTLSTKNVAITFDGSITFPDNTVQNTAWTGTGLTGPQGPQGAQGPAGPTGPQGATGTNIDSIARDVSNLAFGQANTATNLAQSAYNYANTITTGGSSSDYFPTAPYGFVTESLVALVSDNTFIQGELAGPVYDCSDNPITPEGFYLEKDLGYLT
jgi:hypothetical protein